MGRVSGSWLEGPGAAVGSDVDPEFYAGKRLGLPPTGAGSAAGFGRRLLALFIDWILCVLIAGAVTGHHAFDGRDSIYPLWPPLILAIEYIVLVSTLGFTVGMRICGIGVRSVNGRRLGFGWVVVRTVLLFLLVPAVVYDRDHRGLHDKAAGAVVVRL